MEPQLVAIGGGGFADGPDNLLLEDYILSLANKPNPKVSFLPTASGDSEQYLLKFAATKDLRRKSSCHFNSERDPYEKPPALHPAMTR